MVEDLPVEALRTNEKHLVIPPLHGALLKNEQDVHLFERLAFLARRGGLMFAHLIDGLRQAGLPTSITEYLTLLGAMKAGVAEWSVDDFYYLSRATLVKDERHLDRFDRVFAQCFKGLEPPEGVVPRELPEEWLRKLAEKLLIAGGDGEDRGAGRVRGADAAAGANCWRSRRGGIRAARNGSAPRGPRRSARTATIRKACASGSMNRGIAAR